MCVKFQVKRTWSRSFFRSQEENMRCHEVSLEKGSTCKKVLAPVKEPWLCLFGMKFNTHVSHIYLRLNVEGFSTNRLDCRDNWRFHNVYKFPFSCSPSCHPFWRNFSVVIWSGEYFRSDITSNRVGVLVNFHLRINGLFCSIRYVYMIF